MLPQSQIAQLENRAVQNEEAKARLDNEILTEGSGVLSLPRRLAPNVDPLAPAMPS
jgi:hypothetical protein